MNTVKEYLPSYCYSKEDMGDIDGAVIHYISAVNILPDNPFSLSAILQIFRDYKVSAHYLIDRDGTPIELVPLPKRAYHAGKSIMNGRIGCNNFTIGIELMGGAKFDYEDAQIASLSHLLADLMTRYEFGIKKIRGHDNIRAAWNDKHPDKKAFVKVDPGEHFPWQNLRESLMGVSDAVLAGGNNE